MDKPTTNLSDDLRRYLALAWRWSWLLILSTLLAGGAAYYISSITTPVYQAISTVLINEAPATLTTEYTSIIASQQLAQTYAQMMTKDPIIQGVLGRLNLAALTSAISVEPVRDSQLITVKVEDANPQLAAEIANILPDVFAGQNQALQEQRYSETKDNLKAQIDQMDAQIQEANRALSALEADKQAERDYLESNLSQYRQSYTYLLQSYEAVRLAEAQSISNIVLFERARIPIFPIRPQTAQNTALAAMAGLVLAVGLVFLIEALDNTLKTPEDVTRALGLPVIGLIGEMNANRRRASKDGKGPGVFVAENPRSPVAEAFRTLRTNLDFAGIDRPIRTLLVTSSGPSEGKTTTAINLAACMAQGSRRVILVDSDLRRPSVHKFIQHTNRAGLTDLIRDQSKLPEVVRSWGEPGIGVITSGSLPPNPTELLGSERMDQILARLKESSDIVILDSPPFVVADPIVLSARVDGVLLVVEPGRTRVDSVQVMLEQLQRAGARVVGVVLNPISRRHSSYYGKYRASSEYFYRGYRDNHNGENGSRKEKIRLRKKETG